MYICTLKSLKVHRNRSSYPYTPPTGLKDMIPVWERLVIKNKAGFIFILGTKEHFWSSPKNHWLIN